MQDRNKIDQLASLLGRLNAGDNSQAIKLEAKQFLASISPAELSAAEQKLIEAGLEPEDLRHLCSAHMEMLEGELAKLKLDLEPDHVIATLVSEHEAILGFLDELEAAVGRLQAVQERPSAAAEIARIDRLARNLLNAEPHHRREEEALFPEIEEHGVFGPTRVMLMEHQDLRRYKQELKAACGRADSLDLAEAKAAIGAAAKLVIAVLRDHIFKENNILYPTALEAIKAPASWQAMKLKCDRIGYCQFDA